MKNALHEATMNLSPDNDDPKTGGTTVGGGGTGTDTGGDGGNQGGDG